MTPALETKNLVKRFGGLLATGDVTMALPHGARHALIGPNGAGKTTFVNLLSGALAATSGTVRLAGKDITRWPMDHRARAGLARTFQINRLFADFTPLETIALVLCEQRREGAQFWRRLAAKTDLLDEAYDVLDGLGLEPEERRVPIQEWKDAAASGELAEVFACGTAAVVTPVGELKWDGGSCDHRREGHSDEIALKIRKTLLDIQYGRAEDKHGWMTRLA